jgi:hypothetical protein
MLLTTPSAATKLPPRPMRLLSSRLGISSAVAVFAAATACSNPNALPPVQFDNVVDTTTLYALTGTPIGNPSGYDGVLGVAARTDLNSPFDFAIDFDASGQLFLYPSGTLGLSKDPGILVSTDSFDGVTSAPLEGYVQDSTVVAQQGTVFVLKTRPSASLCAAGSLPRYGKFHILAVDAQARTVTFELLIDRNCGYRDLQPGTPQS